MPASALATPSLRSLRPIVATAALLVCLLVSAPGAVAATGGRTLIFHGVRIEVPAGWPVIRLADDPRACVRFDRHAVYLGRPGADQRCPAAAAGRTEAVLVSPLNPRAGTGALLPVAGPTLAAGRGGSEAQLVRPGAGVVVTATWNHHPQLIRRALGLRSLATAVAASARPAATDGSRLRPAGAAARIARGPSHVTAVVARAAQVGAPAAPGQIFTGLGFDACATPSQGQMTAWSASHYQAIGVYIGGTNMACAQPNLTATWVSAQSAAGWHLIPIYVGLQAPSNSCGCASISPASAAAEGTAAARDAVTDAQSVGLGPGNPLYLDMEAYSRTTTNTTAVLAFEQAWTAGLHALGYQSGIYSSAASGIQDLITRFGSGFTEPDDIWIANWNGQQSTADPGVPAQYWAAHQRLHQYSGDHNETYQGTTINIDGDYLDGATAAAGSGSAVTAATTPAAAPSLSVSTGPDGSVSLHPSWPYESGVVSWQVLGETTPGAPAWLGPTTSATGPLPIVTTDQFPYYAVAAIGATGQTLAVSAPAAAPAHVAIFGQNVFVPHRALGALPVACFGVSPCSLRTTITIGRTTLTSTSAESIGRGAGLAYFQLSPAGQSLLARAAHHQRLATVTVRGPKGVSASRRLTLTSFSTADPNPPRSVRQAAGLRFIGTTEFVSHGWVGGVLAACSAGAPCQASGRIVAGGRVVARLSSQTLGNGQLGYLIFTLTAAGHRLLGKAHGNQLAASISLTGAQPAGAVAPSSSATGAGGVTGTGGGGGISVTPPPGGSTSTATTATASARVALVAF